MLGLEKQESPLSLLKTWQKLIFLLLFGIGSLLFVARLGTDFFIYYNAYKAFAAGNSPYFPYDIGASYIYHPFVLTVMTLFAALPEMLAWGLWVVLSLLAYLYGILLLSGLRWQNWLFLLLLLMPLIENLFLGQINTFIFFGLVLALDYSENKHPLLAGFFLALAAVIKLTPLILLLYFALTKQWRVIVATIVTLGIFTLIGWLQFGTMTTLEFIQVLILSANEPAINDFNYSLQAYLSLLFPFAETAIAWLFRGLFLLSLGFAAYLTWDMKPELRATAFALFVSIAVFFAPITWLHHFVVLILPILILFYKHQKREVVLFSLGALQISRIFLYGISLLVFVLPDTIGTISLMRLILVAFFPLIAQILIFYTLARILWDAKSN